MTSRIVIALVLAGLLLAGIALMLGRSPSTVTDPASATSLDPAQSESIPGGVQTVTIIADEPIPDSTGPTAPGGVNPHVDRIGGVPVSEGLPVEDAESVRRIQAELAEKGIDSAPGGYGLPGSPEASVAQGEPGTLSGPEIPAAPGEPPEAGDFGAPGLPPEAGMPQGAMIPPEAGQSSDPGMAPESSDPGTVGPAPEDTD